MSRERSRRSKKKRPSAAQDAAQRLQFVTGLHRPPCRWDVMIFELSRGLADACGTASVRLMRPELKLAADQQWPMGEHLARGFEIFLQQWLWGRPEVLGPAPDLTTIDADTARAIAGAAAAHAYEPLLRKWCEDAKEVLLPRPDRDVTTLAGALADRTAAILAERCGPGGDLHDAMTAPLGSAGDALAETQHPTLSALPPPSGDPSLDVRHLALRIGAADAGDIVKGKLIFFVRTDPWLDTELAVEVTDAEEEAVDRVYDDPDPRWSAARVEDEADEAAHFAIIMATDEFCFAATRLGGRSPVRLLIDRQPDLDPDQRRRLERWDAETFYGMFVIREVRGDDLIATRVGNGREYRLHASKAGAMRGMKAGHLILSRVVPWDDLWLMSGYQRTLPFDERDDMAALRTMATRVLGNKLYDPTDAALDKAWALQREQHAAWVELFGTDELLFDDANAAREAMTEFYRAWAERPDETGKTKTQAFEEHHGRKPPDIEDMAAAFLPEDYEDLTDLALVFDELAGLMVLADYRAFLDAFAAGAAATRDQVGIVRDYLMGGGDIDPILFERARRKFPEGVEPLFRLVLRDAEWRADVDFEPTLRKYKGDYYHRPRRPFISLIEDPAALLDAEDDDYDEYEDDFDDDDDNEGNGDGQ